MVKNTYGTGAFIIMNIGTEFKLSKNRLITTIAYGINKEVYYAWKGQFFRSGFGYSVAQRWIEINRYLLKVSNWPTGREVTMRSMSCLPLLA